MLMHWPLYDAVRRRTMRIRAPQVEFGRLAGTQRVAIRRAKRGKRQRKLARQRRSTA